LQKYPFKRLKMANQAKAYKSVALNILSAIVIFLISLKVELQFPMSAKTAKYLGLIRVYEGMALVVWAALSTYDLKS
jgi:hypothetical protein